MQKAGLGAIRRRADGGLREAASYYLRYRLKTMLSAICAGDAHCAVRQLFDTRHACPQGTLQRICLMRASRCLGRRKHWIERSPAAFSIELSPGGIEQASGIGKARLPDAVFGLGRFL